MRGAIARTIWKRRRRLARIVVTGAGGFIGHALCRGLARQGHVVRGLSRRPAAPLAGVELWRHGTIDAATDWSRPLAGADIVIHCAGHAHSRPNAAMREAEPAAAAHLARAAAAGGVRRLVLLGSLKAMAETTAPGRPLREDDPPSPADAYGHMKLAAERALAAAAAGAIETVILRPPLVHGPGVKANFRALLRLVASGVPLPFAAIDNRRSLIFLDNLVDLLARAATSPAAAGHILLARDGDFSTPALIRTLAAALGRPARLFALPDMAFALLRRLPGLGPPFARLTSSLEVDDRATRALLAWSPPVAAEEGLARTARAFRQSRRA